MNTSAAATSSAFSSGANALNAEGIAEDRLFGAQVNRPCRCEPATAVSR